MKYIYSFVFGALLAVLLITLSKSCNSKNEDIEFKTDTVITYDTVYKELNSKPKVFYSQIIEQKIIHDTVKILEDHFTAKIYTDTIKTDTITITITDTVYKNSILGRNIAYTLRYPTRTINNTTIKIKSNTGLYLGLSAGSGLIGSATYIKGRFYSQVQYGTPGVFLGAGYKLF